MHVCMHVQKTDESHHQEKGIHLNKHSSEFSGSGICLIVCLPTLDNLVLEQIFRYSRYQMGLESCPPKTNVMAVSAVVCA